LIETRIRNTSSSSPLFFLEFENAARTDDDEALLLANKMPITNIIQRSIHSTIFSSYSCSFPLALSYLIAESLQAAAAAKAAVQPDDRTGIYGTYWLLSCLRGLR
jgi:hypothetical protein